VTTLILDGFLGWHSRWEGLRKRVEREVGTCRIWKYDTSGRVSIETLSARLVEELRQLDTDFHLVGYSMGGIVIREAMRQAPDLRLKKSVLLHSPHRGTHVARFLPLPAVREMRPGSAFLRRLEETEWQHPTLASWCAGDLMIVPGSSACWSKASQVLCSPVPAHAWPIYSRRIHQSVVQFLST
jgi:pimeloyl-ACP methyl ester carboxylesterase